MYGKPDACTAAETVSRSLCMAALPLFLPSDMESGSSYLGIHDSVVVGVCTATFCVPTAADA